MKLAEYQDLKMLVVAHGYLHDIEWAEGVCAPASADAFAREAIYVICNSGMKAQVAHRIFERVWDALNRGQVIDDSVFRHKTKRAAIQRIYDERKRLFREYNLAVDKIAYLETIPHIGPIVKFHLAKNFGVDCCKPDRHLIRIAHGYDMTPDEMCRKLAAATGSRIGTVDYVIWRAANLGLR